MTMPKSKATPVQPNLHDAIPHLVCAGAAKAIDFYKKAFGAEEVSRLPDPDRKLMHAAITINGAQVFLTDEMLEYGVPGPKTLKGSPVFIHLTVKDVDAFAKRAVKAGVKITMPIADMFWGDRYGQLEDSFGHRWSVATHLKDMTAEETKKAMREAMPMAGAK
jgi:PhnB protein